MTRVLMIAVAVWAGAASAEDEAQRRAREEIERQLSQMVGSQPSRVRVEFLPVDDPNLAVEDFEVNVDGKPLKTPAAAAIAGWIQEGAMPLGAVDVTPGAHKVHAKLTIHNTASALATDEGDHRWKLAGDVAFDVRAGIEVKVTISPVRDAKQTDIAKRLRLTFPSQPVMIAKLEDATMPETPKPKAQPIDAGPSKEELAAAKKAADDAAKLAAADEKKRKADEALAAKQAAADEKKRKAEEALAAKQAAADEKKRKAEAAVAAKQAAAEEKKRKAEEALAAKKAAADEKKRKVEELLAAQKAEAEAKTRLAEAALAGKNAPGSAPTVADAVLDAGLPAPAVVEDAGVAVSEAPTAEDAGVVANKPPPVATEPASEGPPWLVIGGAGLAALVVLIVLIRRAGRVPQIKD